MRQSRWLYPTEITALYGLSHKLSVAVLETPLVKRNSSNSANLVSFSAAFCCSEVAGTRTAGARFTDEEHNELASKVFKVAPGKWREKC